MSIKHPLPFDPIVRLAGRAVHDPDAVSLRSLRDAVLGRGSEHDRAQAMELLLESDFPNKVRDFEQVLSNEADTREARYLAAIYLGALNSPLALDILLAHTSVSDEYVLIGILKALGRIGNAAALMAIEDVQRSATEAVAQQAASAASSIAHRLDLPGHDLFVPVLRASVGDEPSDLRCPDNLRVAVADRADAEICLRSLARRPFDVELLESPIYQMRCGRNVWMIVFTRGLVAPDGLHELSRRRTQFAIVARREPGTGRYSTAFVVFTAPNSEVNGANVLIQLADGDLAIGGQARQDGDHFTFALRSLPGPRPFTFEAVGRLWPGRLEMTVATTGRGEKRRPVPLRWDAAHSVA